MTSPKTPRQKPAKEEPVTIADAQPITSAEVLQAKKSTRFTFLRRTEHTGKRREAALMYCAGVRSVSVLARNFGVSRNTVMEWRDKDRWEELAGMTEAEFEAESAQGLAAWRKGVETELLRDIALIDGQKGKVKATSLEGLLKVKLALLERIQLLRGDATSRQEHVVVSFRREERVERRETSENRAPEDVAGKGSLRGVEDVAKGKLSGLIENLRGKDAEQASPVQERKRREAEVRSRLMAPDPTEEEDAGKVIAITPRAERVAVLPSGTGTRESRRMSRRVQLGIDVVSPSGEQVLRRQQ